MPIFARNERPGYLASLAAFRAFIGAAAITAFPQPATPAAIATLTGVQASATLAFTALPAPTAAIGINGVPITFVAAGATPPGFSLASQLVGGTILSASGVPMPFQAIGPFGLQVALGANVYATLLNLVAVLRAWPDENLQACHYRIQGGNTLLISATKTGVAGNSIAITATANANVTVTGAATVASGTTANTTLAGGAAPTAGHAVLVEPQPHPVELDGAWAICRGYLTSSPGTNAGQAGGSATMYLSDGQSLTKGPVVTWGSGNTLSATQEMAPIPILLNPSGTTAAAPIFVVPPWHALLVYGSTLQAVDILAAPGGAY